MSTGAFAFAQGYLGQSTLVVNGTTYAGSFTPQETENDLLVPISQLAQGMGFSYTWSDNTLSIETAGYQPSKSQAEGPLQFTLSPITTTALTSQRPAYLSGESLRFKLGFTYQGVASAETNQIVTFTVAGIPMRDLSVWLWWEGRWIRVPVSMQASIIHLQPDWFRAKTPTSFAVESSQAGMVTITVSDTSEDSVAPVQFRGTFSY